MKKHFGKIKSYAVSHKIMSTVILILVLFFAYFGYGKITNTSAETRYVTTKVEKGTIISSITGSGQVSSLNSIDLKANVNDTITYIGVTAGEKVSKGKTLFTINSQNAKKAIRDAENNLEATKISLEKLKIQKSTENMNADLAKAYDDGFNTVSNVFLDIPDIMTGLDNMFFNSSPSVNGGQWYLDWYQGQASSNDIEEAGVYKNKFSDSYNIALKAYDATSEKYKSVSRTSDNKIIESLISETYDTTKLISDAIKNANNYLDFVNSSIQGRGSSAPSIMTTHKASLNSYTSKTNSHLLNLLSIKTDIKGYQDAFVNNDLDIQSAELSVKQKESALQDAKDNLSDYYITAPFDGTISSVSAQIGATSSGTLGTIITNTKMATISLNEVDVAKVQLGQKATLTFDAVSGLTITGKVVQIDSVGTVSQGVVNYNVKISFDTDDTRIKPGMSVTATVITDMKQDVLIVSSSAVKTQNNSSYVEVFKSELPTPPAGIQGSVSTIPPEKMTVETGLSNNTQTEIISGVKEGDIIVTKTISSTTTKTTTPSILNSVGGSNNRNAGAAARVIRGD